MVCGLKAFAPVLTHRTPFLAVAALRKTAAREKFFVVGFGRRCRSLGSGSKHHGCLDRARASSKLQAWSRKMATRRMLAQEKEVHGRPRSSSFAKLDHTFFCSRHEVLARHQLHSVARNVRRRTLSALNFLQSRRSDYPYVGF